jgi:hypothetical protein
MAILYLYKVINVCQKRNRKEKGFLQVCTTYLFYCPTRSKSGATGAGEPSRAGGARGDFRVLYEVSGHLACMLEL